MKKVNQQDLLASLRQRGYVANEERARGALTSYFQDVAVHELLGPEEEIELARKIEELEVDVWTHALSHPHSADHVLRWVEARLGQSQPEFRVVRRAATFAKRSPGATTSERLERAARKAAQKLRSIDEDHKHLDDLVIELGRLGATAQEDAGPVRWGAEFPAHVQSVKRAAERAAEARHFFVQANLRLVAHIAAQYRNFGVPFSDLIQEGNIGLMKAVDRYDYRRGYRFSTYASWWVRHMIGRAVADTSRTVRIPVHVRDANQRISRVRRQLTAELGRVPTTEEIAQAAEMSQEKFENVQQAMRGNQISLDEPLGEDGDQARQEIFTDPANEQRGPFDDVYARWMADALRERMSALSSKEIDILSKRYALDGDREWTLQEIADQYGVSRERIRQIQTAALAKLRHSFESDETVLEQQIG